MRPITSRLSYSGTHITERSCCTSTLCPIRKRSSSRASLVRIDSLLRRTRSAMVRLIEMVAPASSGGTRITWGTSRSPSVSIRRPRSNGTARRGAVDDQDRRAETDPVAGSQERRLGDPPIVDEGAVLAPGIEDVQPVGAPDDGRVVARHVEVLEDEIVPGRATDAQRLRIDVTPGARSFRGDDGQEIHRRTRRPKGPGRPVRPGPI